MGKVYLIGAGPGDPRLITVYGKEILQRADCIIYDRLIGRELLGLAPLGCEKIYVGKENHKHIVPQSEIQALLFEKSKQYNTVVRLKGGDPFVFGRGAEEALFLCERNVQAEIIPGVTSAISALTYAGIPITHRGVSKGFRVITAHSKDDILSNINFSSMLDDDETYVFLMGLHHLDEIAQKLIAVGKNPDTPCAVISNASTPRQKKCIAPLSKISEAALREKLTSPATIVVGNAVDLAKELPCLESKPLYGKKILVPYIEGLSFSFQNGVQSKRQNELIDRLKALGALVTPFCTGKIQMVEFDRSIVANASIIAFSSQNAVFSFISQIGDIRNFPNAKTAVVGEKTKNALKSFGIQSDIVAKTANDLSLKLKGKNRILHFCAMQNAHCIGENSVQVPCYENIAANEKIMDIADCNAVVFTCGSNAERTIKSYPSLPPYIYSIGCATTTTLTKCKIKNVIQADESTLDSLIYKIIKTI